MKFSTIIVSVGFAALAAAQSSTTTSEAPRSSTAICLDDCPSGDVTCQASCVGVPSPDTSMVNATTECAAACPQGDGTAGDTQIYSDCVQGCIKNQFYSSGTVTAGASSTATGTAASGSGSGSADATATGSGTGSSASPSASGTRTSADSSTSTATATATGSTTNASAPSASGNAAVAGFTVTGSFIGLFAMAAGLIAL